MLPAVVNSNDHIIIVPSPVFFPGKGVTDHTACLLYTSRFADRCSYRRPECDKPQENYEFGGGHMEIGSAHV